ncbi:GDSL esterase/lipase At1g29670 [Coffea arabica]|uniref:GDSL esterase/lipase At1g29670 n=1 Tax=Coffea arabica TaxID=13443 RepID=A0A6P6SKF4_COFAR|nr:GDSL esterase/lipase At1g29670-like [Coffea arabica]
MAPKPSKRSISFAFFVIVCLHLCSCYGKVSANNDPKIRGMFVFGSSLVDNGNNNFLPNSLAKANYFPYGVDFPHGSTGRFTNGKNVVDLLGELLKLPTFIPPFADPTTKGRRILYGVNYASGASGILDETGAIAGQVFSLNKQIENFENVTLPEFGNGEDFRKSLAHYLFVVGTGGNDYTFNYFLSRDKDSSNVSLEAFTTKLTTTLSRQLKRLYNLGARKFVLMSVNPNGCTPMARTMIPMHERCIQSVNRAIHLFNTNLKAMVDEIQLELPASKLVYVNSYKIVRDIIKEPSSKGFEDAKNACCKVPSIEEGGTGTLCKRGGSICSNRRSNVFFDGLHPTETVNAIIANKAYYSNSRAEVYPMNIKQLSQI